MLLLWSGSLLSQTVSPEKVITPIGFDISPKLSDLAPIPPGYVDQR